MSLETWLAFLVVETVLCVTPGPAVLFVISQAAWRGPKAGLSAAGGVAAANLVYYLLSALGLAALIAASHAVFLTLKWIGAAYLVWLGLAAIADSFRDEKPAPAPLAAKGLRDGLIVQLANPKAMVFFLALVPQFIDPARDLLTQVVILGATTTAVELIVLSAYTALACAGRKAAVSALPVRWMKRGIGGIFLALGAAAALYRRAA